MKNPGALDLSQIVALSLSKRGNSLNSTTLSGIIFNPKVSNICTNVARCAYKSSNVVILNWFC